MSNGKPKAGKQPTTVHVLAPEEHPVNAWLERWIGVHPEACLKRSAKQLSGGDFLFIISWNKIIPPKIREQYRHSLVIHASDLPKDRGWSPHIWTILEGGNEIAVSLLECMDPVDSGNIWHQEHIGLSGTETFDEINALLFAAELRLMDWALQNCDTGKSRPQQGEPSYRRKRTPADSQINPDQSIAEIFDLLRVCDPDRYPAFFEHRGVKYALSIRHLSE